MNISTCLGCCLDFQKKTCYTAVLGTLRGHPTGERPLPARPPEQAHSGSFLPRDVAAPQPTQPLYRKRARVQSALIATLASCSKEHERERCHSIELGTRMQQFYICCLWGKILSYLSEFKSSMGSYRFLRIPTRMCPFPPRLSRSAYGMKWSCSILGCCFWGMDPRYICGARSSPTAIREAAL